MHTITRGVVGLALLTTAATVLVGCSTATTPADPSVAPSTSATPSGSSTSDAEQTTVDFGDTPEQAAAPACTTLLPTDLVDALVPGVTVTDPLTAAAHVDGSWSALRVAGGTDCWATNGTSPVDDVHPATRDDPGYEGVVVSVLPRATTAFDAATSMAKELQDSELTPDCAASTPARVTCQGSVLAQNAWVTVDVIRLQDGAAATPEAMRPAFVALVDRVRAAVEPSQAGTETGADSGDGSFTTCSPEKVNAVASAALRDPAAQTDTLPWLREYAETRVGAAACVFSAGPDHVLADAVYSSTPRAGWFVEQRLAAGLVDRDDRIELPGLGDHDGAWRTCDASACTIDVVHDGAWTQYLLHSRVAPDTSSSVERWAVSSFTG